MKYKYANPDKAREAAEAPNPGGTRQTEIRKCGFKFGHYRGHFRRIKDRDFSIQIRSMKFL
jgi:hypothetical protein